MAKSKPLTTPTPSTQASKNQALVRIDMNHAVFQAQLFELEKPIRHAAIDTLKKLRQMTWAQVSRRWAQVGKDSQSNARRQQQRASALLTAHHASKTRRRLARWRVLAVFGYTA
jgi:hypothetical protein